MYIIVHRVIFVKGFSNIFILSYEKYFIYKESTPMSGCFLYMKGI